MNEWDIFDCGREAALMAKKWGGIELAFTEEWGQKNSLYVMNREMQRRWEWRGKLIKLKSRKGSTNAGKRDRIEAWITEFKAGRVHIYEHLPFKEVLMLQIENWNPRVEHGDDAVDCGAMS